MNIRVANWFKALALAVVAFVAYLLLRRLAGIVLLLIQAGLVAYVVGPLVRAFDGLLRRRSLAVVSAFVLILAVVSLLLVLAVPLLVRQAQGFSREFPGYLSTAESVTRSVDKWLDGTPLGPYVRLEPGKLLEQAAAAVTERIDDIVAFIPGALGALADLVLVAVVALYLQLALPSIDATIKKTLSGSGTEGLYEKFLRYVHEVISGYALGLLILMAGVGVVTGIGLWLVGVPSPVALGIVAGLLEVIPYFGPIIAAVPAVIVALTVSPLTALLAIVVFAAVQALEGNLLAPFVMGRVAELHPLAVILLLLTGGTLAGVFGIFLAVPVFIILRSFARFVAENFSYVRSDEGPDVVVLKSERETGAEEAAQG